MRVAQQNATQQTVYPPPMGGMDGRIGAAAEDLNVCLWAINMMPVEYGMRVRLGYRVWQETLPSEVRTIVPYEGLPDTGTDDKIFAMCAEGIYDVTAQSGTPTQKLAFANVNPDSGWGVYTHYIDASGDDMIYYADQANGLFIYTPGTDTWAQATGITPIAGSITTFNIADIVYIVSHKLRLWFITRNANLAWYLPVASFQGEATEFFFGAKFKHGGDLVGLYNWTVDGGSGRDDFLVAVSRAGDVLPYQGDDPSSDMTWENIGVFFIGSMPLGNRCASEYGGNLFLLSTYGITSMKELVAGGEAEDPGGSQLGAKMARFMRLDMRDYKQLHGWNIQFVSDEGLLVVNTPLREDGGYRQYVMNTITGGWGFWRDVPYVCGAAYDGDILIGDPTGRVLRMDRNVDDVPALGGDGIDIKWFVLTSFSSLGEPALNKRAKFIRPNFSSNATRPVFDVYAYYNYLVLEPLSPITAPVATGGSLWDTALWDIDTWDSPQLSPFSHATGADGIGRTIAIAMTGRSRGPDLLLSWDMMWDTGGFL